MNGKTIGNLMLMMLIGIVVFVACMALRPAHSGERGGSSSFYDKSGSFSGSTITHGNSTSAYDKSGHFDGTAIRNSDGTTSFYDKSGHFGGSSTNTTQPK